MGGKKGGTASLSLPLVLPFLLSWQRLPHLHTLTQGTFPCRASEQSTTGTLLPLGHRETCLCVCVPKSQAALHTGAPRPRSPSRARRCEGSPKRGSPALIPGSCSPLIPPSARGEPHGPTRSRDPLSTTRPPPQPSQGPEPPQPPHGLRAPRDPSGSTGGRVPLSPTRSQTPPYPPQPLMEPDPAQPLTEPGPPLIPLSPRTLTTCTAAAGRGPGTRPPPPPP